MRAILYARVSRATTGTDQSKSITQQLKSCRAVAEREGWPVAHEIVDDGIGASRFTQIKRRPGFSRLVDVLEPGDVLISWEQSRITRRLAEHAHLADLCEERSVKWHAGGRLLDPSDAEDRLMLGITSAFSEHEAAKIRERVQRGIDAHARAGNPSGRLPFGYRRVLDGMGRLVGWEIDKEQAALLRSWADRVLAGDSLHTLCREANDAGLLSPRGGQWRPSTLKQMLTRPVYAAVRPYKGEDVPGTWPPIWPVERVDELSAALAPRRPGVARGRAPSSLLSAIGRCGVCGSVLGYRTANPNRSTTTHAAYKCTGLRSCVSRRADRIDERVSEVIIQHFADEAGAVLAARSDARDEARRALEEIRVLQARLDDAAERYADGKITVAMMTTITDRIQLKIEAAQRRSENIGGSAAAVKMASGDPRAVWAELTLPERRSLVAQLLNVELLRIPEGQSFKIWNPDTVRITLKQWPGV